MMRQCVRCLSEYEDLIVLPCVGIFQDASQVSESNVDVKAFDEELSEIGLEHLEDVYTYHDHQIELNGMLREQCILNTPNSKNLPVRMSGVVRTLWHKSQSSIMCMCGDSSVFPDDGSLATIQENSLSTRSKERA